MSLNHVHASHLPVRILCDFDGTITRQDVTDTVLSALAAPEWMAIEEAWLAGEIGSGECMCRQVALLRGDWTDLDAVIETIDVDASFPAFAAYCARRSFQLEVVSEGLDYAIQSVLSRMGLSLPVRANHLIRTDSGAWSLQTPHSSQPCQAAHCKCRSAMGADDFLVVIGDGRSDFCVAETADYVFARDDDRNGGSSLLQHCRSLDRPHVAFRCFGTIAADLDLLLPPGPALAPGAAA